MPVIMTDVASTCVDYYLPLVLPFMGGSSGPMCIGPASSRWFSSRAVPNSGGHETARLVWSLSSPSLPLRDCSSSPVSCSPLVVILGCIMHFGVVVSWRHRFLLLRGKQRSTESQKFDSTNSVGIRHVTVIICDPVIDHHKYHSDNV